MRLLGKETRPLEGFHGQGGKWKGNNEWSGVRKNESHQKL
jgi:hypothetical protein